MNQKILTMTQKDKLKVVILKKKLEEATGKKVVLKENFSPSKINHLLSDFGKKISIDKEGNKFVAYQEYLDYGVQQGGKEIIFEGSSAKELEAYIKGILFGLSQSK